MSTLLLFATVFLGLQLFCNKPNGGANTTDYRKPEEIMKEVREKGAKPDTVDVARKVVADLTLYKQRIEEKAKSEKWATEKLDEAKMEVDLLSVDAHLKVAGFTHEISDSEAGYNILQGQERHLAHLPIWEKSFTLADGSSTTAKQSIKTAIDTLDKHYKNTLLLGFIPGYQLIDFLVGLTGRVPNFSYAFAALLLAIIVRAAVWVPMQKQLMWSRQLQQLMPKINELKEAYAKSDPKGYQYNQEYQQRSMALYKEYGVNPAGGCAPMAIQIPLFLIFYNCMLRYKFAFTNGTFLWINEATSKSTNGFAAPNLGHTDTALIVIYGISMLVSQYLAPISNPDQAKQQRMIGIGMSVFITVMMFIWPSLPSAFVLYWIFLNTIATIQSLRAYRMPAPELKKVSAANGTIIPTETAADLSAILGGKNGSPKKKK